MAVVTRRIGLSLGADICWPIAYEEILKRLDLSVPIGRDVMRFEVDRVTIEPFSLSQPCKYDLVIDRLTHWYSLSREWIKKAVIMDGLYVFNNPWAVQSMEKHTSYCAMMHLGFPIPETWLIPPKTYEELPDLKATLDQYARLFDLPSIADEIGYPMFMKPYDGGGWKGVSQIDTVEKLKTAYDESGKMVMHLQAGVSPFDLFVRCIGVGPQTHVVRYDPSAALHNRYTQDRNFMSAADEKTLADMTLVINAFFGWDFNSCEALRKDGVFHPIDFANPCPDSQVTSLHSHWPWLVKSKIKWSVFCAATKRPFRLNPDWTPFYKIAKKGLPFAEALPEYAAIAHERFSTEKFETFCEKHLPHLDEVAHEFFGSPRCREAVQKKVAALFPEHEVEEFTELFWQRIQAWRAQDAAERTAASGA